MLIASDGAAASHALTGWRTVLVQAKDVSVQYSVGFDVDMCRFIVGPLPSRLYG